MSNIVKLDEVNGVAKVFKESGYFADVKSEAQAAVKVMAGQELGIPPFASMNGVYIVKGKTVLSATLMAGLIKKSGRYNYKTIKHTDTECELELYEKWDTAWEKIGVSTFTIADATKAGLTGNPVWKSYPRNMLFARAVSNAARWFCSDVFNGPVYVEGELDEPFIAVDTTAREALSAPVVVEPVVHTDYNAALESFKKGYDQLSEGIEQATTIISSPLVEATVAAVDAGLKPLDGLEVASEEVMATIRKQIGEANGKEELTQIAAGYKTCFSFTDEQSEAVRGFMKVKMAELKKEKK
jgi:hypothetical protein